MAVEDITGPQPEQQPPEDHGARNAALAALGLTLLPTPPGPAGLAVSAQVQMQTALLTALVRFQTRRQRAFIDELHAEVLHQDPQLADVIDELIGRELNFEASFRRKQYDRVQAELPVALAIADPADREDAIRKLFEQERRYTQLREQAMRERVISAVQTWHVRQASPQAAVWKLGQRRTHCPECLALAGPTGARVLPWSIIDSFPPPRHVNCGCRVYTVAHALKQGWVSSGKLSEADVVDAIDTLRLAADALREGLTSVNIVSDGGYNELHDAARDGTDGAGWRGKADKASQGTARDGVQGVAGAGSARVGKARQSRHGMAGQGGHGEASQGKAVQARPGPGRHGKDGAARQAGRGKGSQGEDGAADMARLGAVGSARQGKAVAARVGGDGSARDGKARQSWLGEDGSAREGEAVEARVVKDGVARRGKAVGAWRGEGGVAGHGEAGMDEAWTERFPRGTTFGGRFRPRVGGDPGAALLKKLGLHRRGQRTPDVKPGAWVRLVGRQVRVPRDEDWTRRLGGDVYHSPAGTTNVYRDTKLLPTTHVSHDQIEQAHSLANDIRHEHAIRAMRRAGAPLQPGDKAGHVLSMPSRGYDLVEMRPAGKRRWRLGFHRATTGATASATITDRDVIAAHHDTAPLAKYKAQASEGTPRSWGEFQQDALAWAQQLANQRDAPLRFNGLTEEPSFEDHVGMHDFTGSTFVGRDVRPDVEQAGKARAQGRKLTEHELRGQYSSYWTVAHEIAHSVNPISAEDYHGEIANLEEALAEEMSHIFARERLLKQGQGDVVRWADQNPNALPVLGVYRQERGGLAVVLNVADVPEDQRQAIVEQLAFHTPPAERFEVLGDLIHKHLPNLSKHDAELIARDCLQQGGPPRPVLAMLSPGTTFMDKLADIVGMPKAEIVAKGGTFNQWENQPVDMGGESGEPALRVTGRGPVGTSLQTAKDEFGEKWLVQQHRHDQDHVASELLANRVYREAGFRAPDMQEITTPGGPAFEQRPDDLKKEPELPESFRLSTGILLVEKDGRVTIIKPRGRYGGYEHSFPKGGLEGGLSAQQNAHKELFEETGLHAHIVGTLGDYRGDTGETRYYVGVRTGGEPTPSSETEAVETVRPKQAMEMLNRQRDKDVLADLKKSPLFKLARGKAGAFKDKFPPVVPGKAIAFRALEGRSVKTDKMDKDQLAAGYMADALLANTDVTGGQWGDNLLWDKEHPDPVRVGTGATLEFGVSGGKEFGPVPSEVWSALRRGAAPKDFSDDELREQAAKVTAALPDDRVDELVDSVPFRDKAMRERVRVALKGRLDWMRKFASGDEDLPEPASGDEARGVLADALSGFQLYPEEEEALAAYQDDPVGLDDVARSGKTEPSSEQANMAKHLDNVLTDARVPADLYAYAGLTKEPGEDFGNQTVKQKAYTRLSTDPAALKDSKATVRVLVPGDSHGLFMEDAKEGTNDLLLPRQARLKLTTVGQDEDGRPMVNAILLPYQKPTSLYLKPFSSYGGGSKLKGEPPKWIVGERIHLDGTSINATVTKVIDLGDGATRIMVRHDDKKDEQAVMYRQGWRRFEESKATIQTGDDVQLKDGTPAKVDYAWSTPAGNRKARIVVDGKSRTVDASKLTKVAKTTEAWKKGPLYYDAKTGKTTETPPFVPGAAKAARVFENGDRVQHNYRGWLGTVSSEDPFRVKWDGEDNDAAMTHEFVTKVNAAHVHPLRQGDEVTVEGVKGVVTDSHLDAMRRVGVRLAGMSSTSRVAPEDIDWPLEEWSEAQRARSLEVRRMHRHELGVTPFRPEDEPAGFYDSEKAKQFEGDVSEAARLEGAQAVRVDRSAGVWQGGTEPSYRVRLRGSDDAVSRVADRLGGKYDQDGVLRFASDAKGSRVRLVSSEPVDPDKVAGSEAIKQLPGATVRDDGRLSVVASSADERASVRQLASELGVGLYHQRGNGEYREAGKHYERWADSGRSWRDGPGFGVAEGDGAGRSGVADAGGSSGLSEAGGARADARSAQAGLDDFKPELHPRGVDGRFVKGTGRSVQKMNPDGSLTADEERQLEQLNRQWEETYVAHHGGGSYTERMMVGHTPIPVGDNADGVNALTPETLKGIGQAIRDEIGRHPEMLVGPRKLDGLYFSSGSAPPNFPADWDEESLMPPGDGAMTMSGVSHPTQVVVVNDYVDTSTTPLAQTAGITAASTLSGYGIMTHELGHAYFVRHMGRGDLAKDMLVKHGFTPEDVRGVSQYAVADPGEAIAELYSMRFTPGFADQLDPGARNKFDGLLADVAQHDAAEPSNAFMDIIRDLADPDDAGDGVVSLRPEVVAEVRRAAAENLAANAWVAQTPLLDALGSRGGEGPSE